MGRNERMNTLRRWSRLLHRDLSYFFTGVLLLYAVSGFMLNHKRDFNADYSVVRRTVAFAGPLPADEASWSRGRVDSLLAAAGGEWRCLKHYFPEAGTMKLFLRGGATLTVDLRRGEGLYEEIRRRPLLSGLNRLHYNPSRWWTLFSDLFLAGLVVIVLTGLVMVRGPKGLWGRGGVELLAGMVIPLLFLFLLE